MPYEFLDFATADVAFRAQEPSLELLFKTCADAVMHTMIEDLDTIAFEKNIPVTLENKEIDLLLFDFLQEFIFYKDAQQLLLRVKEIKITDTYNLAAQLSGETLNPEKHGQKVDVKAVTLHQFHVEKREGFWTAQVILDI